MIGAEWVVRELLGEPHANGSWTVSETATHLVQVIPRPFNTQVVLTPKSCVYVYDDGW